MEFGEYQAANALKRFLVRKPLMLSASDSVETGKAKVVLL